MRWAVLATILFYFIPINLSGQYKERNAWYIRPALGDGNYGLVGVSANFISKKDYCLTGFYHIETKVSPWAPQDYRAGFTVIGNGGPPTIDMETVGIMYGRVFRMKPQLIRLKFQGGLIVGKIDRPHKFEKQSMGGGFTLFSRANYKYQYDTKRFAGVILHPTFELLVSKYIAVSVGARANINPQDITAGFDIGLLIGYLRPVWRKNSTLKYPPEIKPGGKIHQYNTCHI